MVCNAGQGIGELGLRINVVEAAGLDQRIGNGRALAATIQSAEQPRLAPERYTAQRPFGGIVREADPTIVEEPGERA